MAKEINISANSDNSSDKCLYCLDISDSFSAQRGFPELLGYVVPLIIMLTVVTNTLAICVLLKRHMRTSTNILLAGLAFSDMMCGVVLLPIFIKFYTLNARVTLVQYEWCMPVRILIGISTGFHTVSVFQTVAIAVQRYIFVCRSSNISKLTNNATFKMVIILYIVGILLHATTFMEFNFTPLDFEYDGVSVTTCEMILSNWISENYELYINAYFWFRSIFLVVVPCIILSVLTGLLLKQLAIARKRRKFLFEGREETVKQQELQNYRTTMMLIAVVILFLLFETPNSVVMTMDAIEIAMGSYSNTESKLAAITAANIVILIGSPANLFLYCGMSKQFRDTLKQMFVCRRRIASSH